MLRNSIANYGPAPFRGAAAPSEQPPPEGATLARLARFTVYGLGVAGVLPPLAFTAKPAELGQIGGVPVSIALTAILILAPALVGLIAALFGLEGVRESFRMRGDKEHEQAVLRVFVATLAVAFGFALEAAPAYAEMAAACQVTGALALAGAWVLLLLTILDPAASPLRYYLATAFDAAMLSAYLHFGAAPTAAWFPLYLLATFYGGFRFGPEALVASAVANVLGFALVVLTTAFWQQQALLAGGLLLAMVVLPAYVGTMVREVVASRAAAAAAQAARTRFMMVISQALRAPLDAIIGKERREPEAPAVAPSARALLSQLNNILDFSAIEAGAFVPKVEAFDLHRLVNDTLAERRAEARDRGLGLRVHIDPAMPYRLRGWPQQFAQILDYLVARAIEVTPQGTVRVSLDAVGGSGNTLQLRLAVRDEGAPIAPRDAEAMFDPFAAAPREPTSFDQPPASHGAFGLAVVKRLVELMGGRITVTGTVAKGGSFSIDVPLTIDMPPIDADLDLGHCLVLIATADSHFASELAEPLNAWHGDPRWIEGFAGNLDFIDRLEGGSHSVLIVDGRTHLLAALTFTHRAVSGPTPPGFVFVVAEPAQIDGLIELAEDELDGVLAAPLNDQLLANALHSLPLSLGLPRAAPAAPPEPEAEKAAPRSAAAHAAQSQGVPGQGTTGQGAAVAASAPSVTSPTLAVAAAPQVTPITAHPRFASDTATVDQRAIAALRRLGDGDAFLGEVIESFRADAKEIMQRIVRAAAAADAAGFARGLHALRNCAANFGGNRLNELLLGFREVSSDELREHGSVLVQRLGDELARLEAALDEYLPERTVPQRGA